jgi:hypothetical protein
MVYGLLLCNLRLQTMVTTMVAVMAALLSVARTSFTGHQSLGHTLTLSLGQSDALEEAIQIALRQWSPH